jgi:uncharacterized protein YabE (DUF348 family)
MRRKFRKHSRRFQPEGDKPRGHRIKRLKRAVRHPVAIPVITVLLMIIVTLGVFAIFAVTRPKTIDPNVVMISHDGERLVVSSKEPTVGTLLKKLNLDLNEGDVVEPSLETEIHQDDFRINIYRAVPLTVVDGSSKQFAFSAATTPRSVARQAGLSIFPEDKVETKPVKDFLNTGDIGQQVVIDRATPINVNLYGANVVMRTHATTVRGLLDEKNIVLKPQDMVTPSVDSPIIAGSKLSVIRNGISTITVQEDIPMPNQIIMDSNLSYGVSAVRQQGAPGKRAVTYEINTQNGKEISRKAIQTVVIQQPVTQITVQGSNLSGIKGDMAKAGIAPSDYMYADYIISHESGWCPTKPQGTYGTCPPYAGYVPATGGYGLCQSTPGSKMATAGADWATNPVTQLRWCSSYAQSKHGGWANAYNFWLRNRWW